jgi:HlyD family secretion protein
MKTKYLIPFIAIVFAACSGKDEKSDAYGNFEVDDIMVSAESTGKLLYFVAEEGKKMAAGELVAVIDTSDLVLKRNQLIAQKKAVSSKIENIQSQTDVQKQQQTNLNTDKDRIEKLLKDGAATKKQLDDINGQLDLVKAQIASTNTQYLTVTSELEVYNAQIAQVNESISKCSIFNPSVGIVLEKYTEPNEITTFGKPLYKIADMDEMTLRVYISGDQLPNIKLAQEVEVLIDQDKKTNRKLAGTVSWVSETAEFTPKIIQTKEERVNMVYAVKVKVKNDGSLKIGMPGEVNF